MSKPAIVAIAVAFAVGSAFAIQQWTRPRFERQLSWAGSGVWLKAETHVHSKFSDGGHTIEQLAERAAANGCDVLAITDHTDGNLKAATPEYHAAIAAARTRVPQLVILTGIEWNVPPGKGQDHAVVLLPVGLEDAAVIGEFKQKFDDENKEGENPELAEAAFAWLRSGTTGSVLPVMFLNHPGRRAPDIDAVGKQLAWLSEIGQGVFVGAEGAPGHQKARPLGAYGGALKPDDRWDPAIAPPGAAWDRQLQGGKPMWGALATSDFHGESNGDYWPCEFSATWLYARERSAGAALEALRAGSFFGVHGDIAREVQLTLTAEGLPRPAMAGESVRLPSGAELTLEVRATVPPADWAGQPNQIDRVELIAVTRDSAEVVHSGPLADGGLRYRMTAPAGGLVIRARGRRVVEDGPDLQFYTNPIVVQ